MTWNPTANVAASFPRTDVKWNGPTYEEMRGVSPMPTSVEDVIKWCRAHNIPMWFDKGDE